MVEFSGCYWLATLCALGCCICISFAGSGLVLSSMHIYQSSEQLDLVAGEMTGRQLDVHARRRNQTLMSGDSMVRAGIAAATAAVRNEAFKGDTSFE
jgi:hypothetical protein